MWPWESHLRLPGLSLSGNEGKIPFLRGKKYLWPFSHRSTLHGDLLICNPAPLYGQNKLYRKVRQVVRSQKLVLGPVLSYTEGFSPPEVSTFTCHIFVSRFCCCFCSFCFTSHKLEYCETQLTDYSSTQKPLFSCRAVAVSYMLVSSPLRWQIPVSLSQTILLSLV